MSRSSVDDAVADDDGGGVGDEGDKMAADGGEPLLEKGFVVVVDSVVVVPGFQ